MNSSSKKRNLRNSLSNNECFKEVQKESISL